MSYPDISTARWDHRRLDLPDLQQIILIQTTLTKDLPCSLSGDEPVALLPSPEDLVIVLLLLFGQRPGDLWGLDRRVLKQRLECLGEGLILVVLSELRRAR